MADLPTSTVTFLLSDIQGSTQLARDHASGWESAQARHHAIMQQAIESNHGHVFQIIGDAFCAAFPNAPDAVRAGLAAQRALYEENWGEAHIHVRMGVHTGEAEVRDGIYHGYLTLSLAQRLMSVASGGQVLVSAVSEGLLRDRLPPSTSLRDLGVVTLKDFPRPERVYQLLAPDLPAEFPPLKSLSGVPNNLPVQLTSFIGREHETSEVKRLLETTRLLTLTGSGGTGKTRLSLAVAGELLDQHPDGVWFVEMAPLADPALVPASVATTLGLREEASRPILESLTSYLRDKTLLLILDNCEHLIEACARLADALLRAAPQLTILASSREALGIAGETAYHVPSLDIPNPQSSIPLIELKRYAAARLFVERAAAAKAGFTLNDANAQAVVQICSRLDGIPLAIELAAARTKVFTPEQIAARLDDRFRLLTGGSRTALPRQQTLRALIDWSYGLLSESERMLLRRLSVFAGGWTLEAAETVCAGNGIEPDDVLNLLTHLVEKSLVISEEAIGEARYRMLETVRQYTREKLFESGEGEAMRSVHLTYFIRWAEAMIPRLRGGPEQLRWFERWEREFDNVRAALDYALASRDSDQALQLVSSSYHFWFPRGHWSEGRRLAERVLSTSDRTTPTLVLARVLWQTGFLAGLAGDNAKAKTLSEESLAISTQLGFTSEIPNALNAQCWAMASQAEPLPLLALCDNALKLARQMGDDVAVATLDITASTVALHANELQRARQYAEDGLAAAAKLEDCTLQPALSRLIGYSFLRNGNPQLAAIQFAASLHGNRKLKDTGGIVRCLCAFAASAAVEGDALRAATLSGALERQLRATGTFLASFDREANERFMTTVRAALDPVAFDAAFAEGSTLSMEQAIAYALKNSASG